MKVGDLKKVLEGVDDGVDVVVPSSDHSYRVIDHAEDATAGLDGREYFEWFGNDHAGPEERPIRVVVIT